MTMHWNCDNRGCFIHTESPDWGVLDGCWPGRVRPTDVDGLVEIKGAFLVLEWKAAGVPLPRGQQIMFTRWAENGRTVVVIIRGSRGVPETVQLVTGAGISGQFTADIDRLRRLCTSWVTAAQTGTTASWVTAAMNLAAQEDAA